MRHFHWWIVPAASSILTLSVAPAAAQDSAGPPEVETGAAEPEADAPASDPSPSVRVGGSSEEEVWVIERSWGTEYRCGPLRVETPLPVGYPAPTAPGVIEIKRYPSVRRAEIKARGREDGMMGWNTSRAFWPLFQHIKDRDIAMTAPVEMDYAGVEQSGELEDGDWSMSFLYREPALGEKGQDGDILIRDTDPVAVVSVGVRGDLTRAELRKAVTDLHRWATASDDWEPVGGARKLSYNGPDVPASDRWHEVQLPIRERIQKPSEESGDVVDDEPSEDKVGS